jgi:hypothetical protein
MPEYTITPTVEPAWRLGPRTFSTALRHRWPDAQVGLNSLVGSEMSVHALIPYDPPRRELGVALTDDCYCIFLDPADPETAAEFVTWYCDTQIPTFDPPVYLITEVYERQLQLRADISADEVLAFLTNA